jgi:hypothetical protein
MDFEEKSEHLSGYMAKVINAKTTAEEAQKTALDAASEFGFEMGALARTDEIIELIDNMFNNLSNTEEDAKLTLEIIKQMILRLDNKDNEPE